MQTRGRVAALAAACAAVAVLAVPAGPSSAADAPLVGPGALVAVQGLSALPAGAASRGVEPPAARLAMRLVLAPRDPAALARFVASVSAPSSPSFRHFLARGQFAGRFGPTWTAIDAVRALVHRDGLRVTSLSPSHLVLGVTGTAQAFATALHAPLLRYALRDGARGYRLARAARLPVSIAPYVAGVVGVSSFVHERSFAIRLAAGRRSRTAPRAADPRAGPLQVPCPGLQDPAPSYNPYEEGQAYGLSTAWSSGFDGTGRTVAVEEFAPYAMSDIVGYDVCNGILASGATTDPQVHNVLVDGGTSPGSASGSDEPTLDIEEVRALAPGANVDVYLGPNNVTGPIDTLQRIATDDTAQAVSISWGICEAFSDHAAETPVFEQMAAQGQTVFAASGDSGSSDCLGQSPPNGPLLVGAAVDDPAAQPLVTGVGGLTVGSLSPLEESVWNDCIGAPGCLGDATGGGISSVFPRPAWQLAPGVPTGSEAGARARLVPDLSVMGDPGTGIIIDYQGTFQPIGGTSMGAPILSALDVVAAQSCGTTTLGFLNPLLYAMARHGGDFNDVTGGSPSANNNAIAITTWRAHEYFAHAGYDMASGLGSPNPATFLPALCDGPATATATPTTPGAASTWQLTLHSGAAGEPAGATLTVTAPPGTVLPGAPSRTQWSVRSSSGTTNPSAVRGGAGSATPNVAALTLAAAIPPVDAVTLVASSVTNPRAVGTGSVVVTDSVDQLAAVAPLVLEAPTPAASRSTIAASTPVATEGGAGARVTVTVRDAAGDTVLGARVTVATTGHAAATLPRPATSELGTATFTLRDDHLEDAAATVSANGVVLGSVAVRFGDPFTSRRPRVLGLSARVLGAPAVAAAGVRGWVALVRTAAGTLDAVSPHGAVLEATALPTAPAAAATPSVVAARGWLYAAYRAAGGDLVVLRHPLDAPLSVWGTEDLTARGLVGRVLGAPSVAIAGRGAASALSVAVVTASHLVDAVTAPLRAPSAFTTRSVSNAASLAATATGSVAQVAVGGTEGYVFRTLAGRLLVVERAGTRWYANDLAQSALLSVSGPDAIVGDPVAVPSPLGDTVAAVTADHRVDEFVGTFANWSAEALSGGVGGTSPPAGHATLPALTGTPVVLASATATVIVVTSTDGRLVELRSPGVSDPWAAYDLTALAAVGHGAATGVAALPGPALSLLCDVAGALVEVRAPTR